MKAGVKIGQGQKLKAPAYAEASAGSRAQEKAVPSDFILRSSSTHSPVFSKPNVPYLFPRPVETLLHYSHICGNIISEVRRMKFVGVREFKQDVVKYLNEGTRLSS